MLEMFELKCWDKISKVRKFGMKVFFCYHFNIEENLNKPQQNNLRQRLYVQRRNFKN